MNIVPEKILDYRQTMKLVEIHRFSSTNANPSVGKKLDPRIQLK